TDPIRLIINTSPFQAGMAILRVLIDQGKDKFVRNGSWMNHPGSDLMDWYASAFKEDVKIFQEKRKSYLLY
ncbi:MAG: hypothetical protein VW270_25130, partial [Candidatus Poseidoniales archaeon]